MSLLTSILSIRQPLSGSKLFFFNASSTSFSYFFKPSKPSKPSKPLYQS